MSRLTITATDLHDALESVRIASQNLVESDMPLDEAVQEFIRVADTLDVENRLRLIEKTLTACLQPDTTPPSGESNPVLRMSSRSALAANVLTVAFLRSDIGYFLARTVAANRCNSYSYTASGPAIDLSPLAMQFSTVVSPYLLPFKPVVANDDISNMLASIGIVTKPDTVLSADFLALWDRDALAFD